MVIGGIINDKKSSMKLTLIFSFVMALLFIYSCEDEGTEDPTLISQVVAASETINGHDVLAKGFRIPWAIEIIGEDEFLISERFGDLYYYKNGDIAALANAPVVQTVSDGYLTYGGLMDVSLHPKFQNNQLVYIAFVGHDYNMKVARFELQENVMHNLSVIFETNAFSIGSRIAWQDDDHFFVSQGSGGNPYPEPGGQNLRSDVGKIHRLTKDGQVPDDNPIYDGFTKPSSVWSYGHRDPQGLFYDSEDNLLYSNEHGPLGGDELNIITKGGNYGWPIFSHGLNYDESPVSDMTEEEARNSTELPIEHWTPSIAPSCLLKLRSSNFEELNGSLLMGSLSQESIISYDIENAKSEKHWEGIGRVRDIGELPSGDLLVVIDRNSPRPGNAGRLIRITTQ